VKGTVKPWQRVRRKQLADCRIFSVEEVIARSPGSGQEHGFYLIETGDWINLVPVTRDRELVCIEQYRHGSDQITLEIPGGMLDLGENPAEAAIRECLEETGYEVRSAQPLGVLNPNPAIFSNSLHTYIGTDAREVAEISNTATEETRVVLVPLDDVESCLLSGRIDHALVAATLWRMLYLLKTNAIEI